MFISAQPSGQLGYSGKAYLISCVDRIYIYIFQLGICILHNWLSGYPVQLECNAASGPQHDHHGNALWSLYICSVWIKLMHTPGERDRDGERGREWEGRMSKHLTYAYAAEVAHTPTHTGTWRVTHRYLWDCGQMGMFVLIVGVLLIEYADANMQVPCTDLHRRLCVWD